MIIPVALCLIGVTHCPKFTWRQVLEKFDGRGAILRPFTLTRSENAYSLAVEVVENGRGRFVPIGCLHDGMETVEWLQPGVNTAKLSPNSKEEKLLLRAAGLAIENARQDVDGFTIAIFSVGDLEQPENRREFIIYVRLSDKPQETWLFDVVGSTIKRKVKVNDH
jgi:hypothetical protein